MKKKLWPSRNISTLFFFFNFPEYAEWKAGKRSSVPQKTAGVSTADSSKSSHTVSSGNENKVNMSEHDQTRSNQNNLEETGKQIGNLIADDMDMDPENEMEVDPAEEVTVSGEKPLVNEWIPLFF